MIFRSKKLGCILLVAFCALFLASCATTRSAHLKSFTIGKEQTVSVGASMIIVEDITYIKQWVGLLDSPTGYKESATEDSFKEELIYTGRSGDTLNISYREYRKEFARPAFYQELHYDLGKSDLIVFRNYRMKVLNADNEQIVFIVLTD